MARRNLSLTPRPESVREQRPVQTPVHFTLEDIKRHFEESMETVENQYQVAETLLKAGNDDGCKMIWRSQIVLADLFKRRNEIAHQNDRSHASAEQNDITREYVEDYITKINLIVNSINTIAEEINNIHGSDSDNN